MNRSLLNLSLTLLLACSLLASGCCMMSRHHGCNNHPCAKKCQTPCAEVPCKSSVAPVEVSPTAPSAEK